MSKKYSLYSITNNQGQLQISGCIVSDDPKNVRYTLQDQDHLDIPCTIDSGNDDSFVIIADHADKEVFYLTITDGASSEQIRIDAALMRSLRMRSLARMFNRRNFKKATKFLREYGLKNTLLRFTSEVESTKSDTLEYNVWKQLSEPQADEIEAQRELWKQFDFPEGRPPMISIVIPAYNTDKDMMCLLLDSIRAQTYPNFEVVIADGSEPDCHNVEEVLNDYSQKDSRFRRVPTGGNLGISGNTNVGLAAAEGDFIAFCDHDDELSPWALFEVAKAIAENPRVQFLYTDEDKIDIDGKTCFDPHMKSDFNPALLETNNYICHLNVVRKDLLEAAGDLKTGYDGAQDFDFVLRCSEVFIKEENEKLRKYREALESTEDTADLAAQSGLLEDSVKKIRTGRFISERAVHIPKVCYHWKCNQNSTAFDSESKLYAYDAGVKAVHDHHLRCGTKFQETAKSRNFGYYRTIYGTENKAVPLLSVLIPTDGSLEELDACLRSLINLSAYRNLELILLAPDDPDQELADFLRQADDPAYFSGKDAGGRPLKTDFEQDISQIRIRAIPCGNIYTNKKDEKNLFPMYNKGFASSEGEYILTLGSALTLKDPASLYEMTGWLGRDNVGAVGARLVRPDASIENAGIILATDLPVDTPFRGLREFERSYMHRMVCAQNLSALTGRCLLTTREIFQRIGGFDEQFTQSFADIDACLKIRQLGFRLVYAPDALFQYSRYDDGEQTEAYNKNSADSRLLQSRWKEFFSQTDPYYNPQFLSDRASFQLGIDLNQKG